MKSKYIALMTFVLAAALNASAQVLPTSGVWPATTLTADETVRLTGDIDLQGTITVNAGATLRIEIADEVSGDVSIKRSANVTMFTASGSLIVKGNSATKRVVIDGNYLSGSGNTGFGILGNNAVSNISMDYAVLQNIYNTITASRSDGQYGSAVVMGNKCGVNSSIKMSNCLVQYCEYSGNANAFGGVLFFNSSQSSNTSTYPATFENCTFKNNKVTSTKDVSGGVIHADANRAIVGTITGCEFTGNTSSNTGASIVWRSDYPGVTITDCTFQANGSPYGPGVYSQGSATIDNSTFSLNEATNNGGAIYFAKGTANAKFTLRNKCKLAKNTAGGNGGAIAYFNNNTDNTGEVIISDAEIINNISASNGGGLYIAGNNIVKSVTITGTKINGNESTGADGGGIAFVKYVVTTTISGSNVNNNKALNNGGGIYASTYGTLSIQDASGSPSTINGNTSTNKDGGALYLNKTNNPLTLLNVTGTCEMSGNTAGGKGGALFFNRANSSNTCNAILDAAVIKNNEAVSDGGAIYIGGSVDINAIEINNTTIEDNKSTSSSGGGIALARLAKLTASESNFIANKAQGGNGGAISATGYKEITISGGSFNGNTATADGGAIYTVKSTNVGTTFTLKDDCKLNNNQAGANGGAISFLRNYAGDYACKAAFDGITISNNTAESAGGGVYFAGSQNINNIDILNSTLSGNKSKTSYGGGVAIAKYTGEINLTNTQFSNNTAENNGGGLALNTNVNKLTMTGASFKSNKAVNDGGAAYLKAGTIVVSGGLSEGNEAVNGGAFALNSNTAVTLTIKDDCQIASNTASSDGGAVFFEKANDAAATLSLEACNLYSNKAANGAGIAVKRTNTANTLTFNCNNGIINNNIASENGGGIFVAGGGNVNLNGNATTHAVISGNKAVNGAGAYLTGTTAVLQYSELKDNIASGNGGGLYVNAGTITFTQSTSSVNYNAVISGNKAVDGAGAYLYAATANLHSGEINTNTASRNGGGIFATGGKLTFTGLSNSEYFIASENIALNGAGMYLTGAAATTIKWAKFNKNHAVATDPISTAWKSIPVGSETIQGIGGGIYVATGSSTSARTTLAFGSTTDFGVFDNIADNGAAELFADGEYTNITIPTVSLKSLNLLGASGKASGWFEDYVNNDTNYNKGTAKSSVAGRYPNIIAPVLPSSANIADTYICLTMGFARSIIVKVSGLKKDDNTVFTLKKDGETVPFETFAITGTSDTGETVSRIIKNLELGKWTIEETGWSWSYDPASSFTRSITKDLTDSNDSVEYLFSFEKASTINSTEAKAKNDFKSNSYRISIDVKKRTDEDGGFIGL